MPKHRTLTLEKFVRSISWEFFQRYFDKLQIKRPPSDWALINAGAMEHFLNDPDNAEFAGIIQEDFRRINDICENGTAILVRTYQRYGISFDSDESPQQLSMRLFLDHPIAFEFAWSRYLLYGTSATLSIYPLSVKNIEIIESKIALFQSGIQDWFAQLAKGNQCIVSHYEDREEVIFLIRHGTYVRAFSYWDGDQVSINSVRPALEDVMVFDPITSQLQIRASLPKDRIEYLRLFSLHILGDESLAKEAEQNEVFTLTPLQDGTFNFDGEGPIRKIDLVETRMKVYGVSDSTVELKANNLLEALQHDLKSLSLKSGFLTMARFKFHLHYSGKKPMKVIFKIEPPSRTDLAQKRYADVIENYLRKQGVKLR